MVFMKWLEDGDMKEDEDLVMVRRKNMVMVVAKKRE